MKIAFANGERWSKNNFSFINGHYEVVSNIEDCDLLIFTGGGDINPKLYWHPVSKTTSYNDTRDNTEVAAFRKAAALGKPMFGICRGAQLLTALNGGKLIQDVNNHTGKPHNVLIKETSQICETNSYHHQMMFPYNLNKEDYIVLAASIGNNSDYYIWQDDKQLSWNRKIIEKHSFNEPELVYYPKNKCLAVQGHPEWLDIDSVYCTYIALYIDKMLERRNRRREELESIEGFPMLEEYELVK